MPSLDASPVAKLEEAEVRQRVLDAVKALPANLRIAVLLLKYHGLSYEEVAEVLHSSLGTVKSRISRAREELRRILLKRP